MQKVAGAFCCQRYITGLFVIKPGLFQRFEHAVNTINGRANFMTHTGQKLGFELRRFFRSQSRIFKMSGRFMLGCDILLNAQVMGNHIILVNQRR